MICFSYTATHEGKKVGNSRHCRSEAHALELIGAWNAGAGKLPAGHRKGTVYAFLGMNGRTPPPEPDYYGSYYRVLQGSARHDRFGYRYGYF